MTLLAPQIEKILESLVEYYKKNFEGTDAQFCKLWNINTSVWNRIKRGERTKLISHDKLISIGRQLGVHFSNKDPWNVVETQTYEYI